MKKVLSLLAVLAIMVGSAQAIVLMDSVTNNGSFETPPEGVTSGDIDATIGWTKEGSASWAKFTTRSYSVTDGSWGFAMNNGQNSSIVSDTFDIDVKLGETFTLAFDIGSNGSVYAADTDGATASYTAWLILDGTSYRLFGGGSYAYVNNTAGYDYTRIDDTFTATSDIATAAVKININNNGSNDNDQVYLDNISLSVTPEPATMALLGLGGLFIRRRR